jgi:hypothetical protein
VPDSRPGQACDTLWRGSGDSRPSLHPPGTLLHLLPGPALLMKPVLIYLIQLNTLVKLIPSKIVINVHRNNLFKVFYPYTNQENMVIEIK